MEGKRINRVKALLLAGILFSSVVLMIPNSTYAVDGSDTGPTTTVTPPATTTNPNSQICYDQNGKASECITTQSISGTVYMSSKAEDHKMGNESSWIKEEGTDDYSKTLNLADKSLNTDSNGVYSDNFQRNFVPIGSTFKDTTYKIYVDKRVDSDFLTAMKIAACSSNPLGWAICAPNAAALIQEATTQIWLKGETEVTIKADGTIEGDPDIIVTEVTIDAFSQAITSAIQTFGVWAQGTISWTVSSVNSLLNSTEDYVIGKQDKSTNGVQGPWLAMRNIALTLLVLALLIIAFANVLQIDIEQYGLNRMIPKIIISIIMAYASWIIFIFFFDFTRALQNQALGLINGPDGLGALGKITIDTSGLLDSAAGIGAALLLLVIVFGTIVCAIVLLFLLLLRVVMLSFLLAVAPLAFILNIAPFTSNLYKQWWNEFWKWMFMGPVAVIIIALGSVIASSVQGHSGTINTALTLNSVNGGEMLIGILILAASLYMAATLPLQWGGNIMKSWGKVGKGAWGLAKKGAGMGWKATGVPGAAGTIKGSVTDWMNRGLKQRENKMAFGATGGRSGIDPRAMKRSVMDAEVQTYRKQFEQARVSKDELNNYAMNSNGPKAMAAWQILQDKDWMPSDLEGTTDDGRNKADVTQAMWSKYYKDNGVEAGDSLYWGNRKKHPQLESIITTARGSENPKLTTASLMGAMSDADYPDIEKDALKRMGVASKLALTEKRAESLKPEQIDALTGNNNNTRALKETLNRPGASGKSFRDGLFAAVDSKNSGAVRASLDAIRQRAARDFGDVGIQHLDDSSLLNLINKRF